MTEFYSTFRPVGSTRDSILAYESESSAWLMGSMTRSVMAFDCQGNTAGFGDLTRNAIRFFTGDFTGDGRQDVLFYCANDGNWWLGQLGTGKLVFNTIGNTAAFGDLTRNAIRFFTGDFTGDGRQDVLFYCANDGNWWLGQLGTGKLVFNTIGNTAGFGDLTRNAIRLFTGDFTGDGRQDVLFYCANDGNWWLGQLGTGKLVFNTIGNTAGFGDLTRNAIRLFTGDFTGDGRQDVLFYCANDGNWWLGQLGTGKLVFNTIGNTAAFGDLTRNAIRFFTGDFTGDGRQDVLFYCANDGNWWLGQLGTGKLVFNTIGNTAAFGDLTRNAIRFFTGDFTGDGRQDVLFYCANDGNWWLGQLGTGAMQWGLCFNQYKLRVLAFKSTIRPSPWRLDRVDVAQRLEQLLEDPDSVRQGDFGFCGIAAFLRYWASRDPDAVARFTIELFNRGKSKIGTYSVEPCEELLHCDYVALNTNCPSTDWMIMGALQDSENAVLDFEGSPDESWALGANSGEVAEWLDACDVYDDVGDECNGFFTKDVSNLRRLQPSDTTDVICCVNATFMRRYHSLEAQTLLRKQFPSHFFGLNEAVVESGGEMWLEYWTWASSYTHVYPITDIRRDYYGAVVAKARQPFQNRIIRYVAPTAPTNLTARVTALGVELSWSTTDPDVTYFEVQRSVAEGPFEPIRTVPVSSPID